MKQDIEREVRDFLASSEGPQVHLQGFVSETVASAVKARRKRRLEVAGASLLSASALVLAAAVVPNVPGSDQDSHAPVTGQANDDEGWAQWAAELPKGPGPKVALSYDNHLVVDGRDLTLDADSVELIGPLADGRFAMLLGDDTAGGGLHSYVATVSAEGKVDALPDSPYQVQNEAVSPDGAYIAYGSSVFDTNSGSVVVAIPKNMYLITAWTNQGIIYKDGDLKSWIWTPGGTEAPISGNPAGDANAGGYVLDRSQGCTNVVRADASGDAANVMKDCSSDLDSVSPDGQWAIRPDLVATNSHGQEEALDSTSPATGLPGVRSVAWEDPVTLLTVIYEPASDGSDPELPGQRTAWIVRCTLGEGNCELSSSIDLGGTQNVTLGSPLR